MWRRLIFSLLYIASACGVARQGVPAWLDSGSREQHFPASRYFTGLAMGTVRSGEDLPEVANRLKKEAQALLVESIRVRITSDVRTLTQSSSNNTSDDFYTVFTSAVRTTADADMVGIKTDVHFDRVNRTLYAFAYAGKRELITYYTAAIASDRLQIQGLLQTATQLEQQREKAKARKHYEDAATLLEKTAGAMDVLRALSANLSGEALPFPEWQAWRDEAAQALARLELLVYVNDREELFGQPCAIVANKLKAELAKSGYRFMEDATRAEYTLNIRAATRKIGDAGGTIVFCFADVVVEWVDNAARAAVYKEELSHKGGSTTFERAGREALEEAAAYMAEKLNTLIK